MAKAKTPLDVQEAVTKAFAEDVGEAKPRKVLLLMIGVAKRHPGDPDDVRNVHLLHRRMEKLRAEAPETAKHFDALDQAMRSGSPEDRQKVIDAAHAFWLTLRSRPK